MFVQMLAMLAVVISTALAVPATAEVVIHDDHPCTTGDPVTSEGYTITYVKATPTVSSLRSGYTPEPDWASSHILSTFTFVCPEPTESGFAYAQFKCQFSCNAASGSSYFIEYVGGQDGTHCTCYDQLLEPSIYTKASQTLVGGWNAPCKATTTAAATPCFGQLLNLERNLRLGGC